MIPDVLASVTHDDPMGPDVLRSRSDVVQPARGQAKFLHRSLGISPFKASSAQETKRDVLQEEGNFVTAPPRL